MARRQLAGVRSCGLPVLGQVDEKPPMKSAACCSCQPIPLTIEGPSRVATASGNRFQTAINIASFGLRGFKSGIEVPGDNRY